MLVLVQNDDKPMKLSKHRRNSSVLLLALPKHPDAPSRLPRALVSSLLLALRQPSFRTNIYLPIRFYSCGSSLIQRTREVLLLSLGGSRGSVRCGWCRGGRELHSSNTRTSRAQSVRKKLRVECPWGRRGSRFALHIRGNEVLTVFLFIIMLLGVIRLGLMGLSYLIRNL